MKLSSNVYKPWALVRHEGELKLAFITVIGGGGMVPSPVTGYRGHLMPDEGIINKESEESHWFGPGALVKDWRNKPTLVMIEKARKENA